MMQLQRRSNMRPLSLHLNERDEAVDTIGSGGGGEAKWDWAEEMGQVRAEQSYARFREMDNKTNVPGSPSDLNTGNRIEGSTGCPSWCRPLRLGNGRRVDF